MINELHFNLIFESPTEKALEACLFCVDRSGIEIHRNNLNFAQVGIK